MRKLIHISRLGIFLFIVILTVSNCFRTRNPLGQDNEIRIVADSTMWKQAEPILKDVFEKVEYTPQPEKVFKIIKADLKKNFRRFKNLIFLSTLEAEDEISKSINANLAPDARIRVESGNIIFIKKDEWAQYQMIMFLIGKDLPSLLNKIEEQKSEIFFQFEDYWNKFHEKILYSYKEQFDIEKHVLKNYGWMIRVPADFELVVQSAADRFLLFERPFPPRWFAVYWMAATDPTLITTEWCITKRNEITKKFLNDESVEEQAEPVIAEEVIFLNRRALKLKGLWKNAEALNPAGGPFRLYCFFDEPTKRIYFIDMHLFSPGFQRSKLHYLRQMEILAHTFTTNLEIKPGDLK